MCGWVETWIGVRVRIDRKVVDRCAGRRLIHFAPNRTTPDLPTPFPRQHDPFCIHLNVLLEQKQKNKRVAWTCFCGETICPHL